MKFILSWKQSWPKRLRKNLWPSPNWVKELRGPIPWRETGKNLAKCWLKLLSVSHCFCMAQQMFVYRTFAFFIFLWITFFLFEVLNPFACMHTKSFSHVWLFATIWTVAHQAPLSMGFSRQEYWSGLPCLSLGESSQSRDWTCISCIAGGFFYSWATGEVP